MMVVATCFLTNLLSSQHVIQAIIFFCRLCHKLKVRKKTTTEYPSGSVSMPLEYEKCPWERQMENSKMLKQCSLIWIGFRTF
jgi:hypothetical protein